MSRNICFGNWNFDPDTLELHNGDVCRVLEPRVARLLEFLLAHPDELLTHDRLVEAVWDGRVVSDEAVRRAVSLLRRALEDEGPGGFIRTIHKKGYIVDLPSRIGCDGGGDPVDARPLAPSETDATRGSDAAEASIGLAEPGGDLRAATRLRASRAAVVRQFAGVFGVACTLLAVTLLWWRLTDGPTDPALTDQPEAVRTLAVLPFVNLGAPDSGSYLADGIAEELLGTLGRNPALRVTARSSSFQFKGQSRDLREVGRLLDVRYVLEGSVRVDGTRVRVGVQLVDTATGAQIWSERYDRSLSDLFALQADIGVEIARELQVILVSGGGGRAPAPVVAEAHLEFLRARELLSSGIVADADRGIDTLQRVIAIDPDYAAAYALLAEAQLIRARALKELDAIRPNIAALVDQALRLDPQLGEAYILRASMEPVPVKREDDLRKGLALSPGSSRGHMLLAEELASQRQWRDATQAIDRAIALDPLSPRTLDTKTGILIQQGELDDAETVARRVLELDPRFTEGLGRMADLCRMKGEFAAAVEFGERALALDPHAARVRDALVESYLKMGEVESARALNSPRSVVRDLQILARAGDWAAAAARLYAIAPEELAQVDPGPATLIALRDAQTHGNWPRAAQTARRLLHYDGRLPDELGPWAYFDLVRLAMLMKGGGDASAAERLLDQVLLAVADHARQSPAQRALLGASRAAALAQRGDLADALAALMMARTLAPRRGAWTRVLVEPGFDPLRAEPEFQRTVAEVQAVVDQQRVELDRLRREGRIPDRRADRSASG